MNLLKVQKNNIKTMKNHKKKVCKISKLKLRKLAWKRHSSNLTPRIESFLQASSLDLFPFNNYECSICLEFMVDPVVTQCGHMFCFRCLEEINLYSFRCPICRTEQTHCELRQEPLVKALYEKKLLQSYEHSLNYAQRLAAYQKWKQERIIDPSNMRIGDNIDVKDQSGVWRKGTIEGLSQSTDLEVCYIIGYKIKNRKIEDKVLCGSRKLAQFKFYTNSKFLDRRKHTINDEEQLIEQREDNSAELLQYLIPDDLSDYIRENQSETDLQFTSINQEDNYNMYYQQLDILMDIQAPL